MYEETSNAPLSVLSWSSGHEADLNAQNGSHEGGGIAQEPLNLLVRRSGWVGWWRAYGQYGIFEAPLASSEKKRTKSPLYYSSILKYIDGWFQ